MNPRHIFNKDATKNEQLHQLYFAAMDGDVKKLKELIKADVNLDFRYGEVGVTAVMVAAERNHAEFIRVAAEAGANLNFYNRLTGYTALDIAETENYHESADVLRKKNAQSGPEREVDPSVKPQIILRAPRQG